MTHNFFTNRFICSPQEAPLHHGVNPTAEPDRSGTAGPDPPGSPAGALKSAQCCRYYITVLYHVLLY